MRALITGATGLIGSHLSRLLRSKRIRVYGTYYPATDLLDATLLEGVRLVRCDIRSSSAMESLVSTVKPDRVYHLAAQSLPTLSWKDPILTIQTNVLGTINLFEAIRRQKSKARVLVACSSAEYGYMSARAKPVRENHPLMPLHPYGVSKVAQDLLAYQYFVNFSIPNVRVRIFNTTGPGKVNDFCSDIARRIVGIEKGLADPPLGVGNLLPIRDITDVRDAVRGLYLLLERGKMGDVYNLCSGKRYRISALLRAMIELSRRKMTFEVSPELLRPSDEPIIAGNNMKLRRQTGWRAMIPIKTTLGDIIDFWRRMPAA